MKSGVLLAIAFCVLGALVAADSPAFAQSPEALKKAQASFDQAQTDYLQGKYDEAATGFQEAYAARPFPQFLYNVGASYHMKGKKTSDIPSYQKAVEFYKKYLQEEPTASDKPKVEKAIGVLEAEIKRLQELAAQGTGGGSGSGSAAAPVQASAEVQQLGDVKVRGLVVIVTEPQNATIYIDDKSIGAVGKTPLVPGQNIKPGKHTFWVTSEGYDEYTETIDIAPGETKAIKASLKGSPIGKLTVTGMGIEDSRISIDGQTACEPGPCLKNVPEGPHTIEVTREGYKPYRRRIVISPKTETTIKVQQAEKPGRGDAITAYVVAAIFGGGGIYLGTTANGIRDELKTDIAAGMPPVDNNDPRFLKGKIYAIAADGCFAIGGIALLTAVYYTFRDKGPPTRASIDVRAVALTPQLGPTYAGLGMETRF